jgi:hypothetical protein
MRVGPATPYVELRHMRLGGFQSTNAEPTRTPLTLGVRFTF